jgi:hypothetical protein
MRKIMLGLTIAVLTGNLISVAAVSDLFDELVPYIRNGNAKEVAKNFNSTIDFATPEHADLYSKAQAELLLRDFFKKYPAKNYSIQHRGASAQGARYVVGRYEYAKGVLRVYILTKEQSGQELIQELHFENE